MRMTEMKCILGSAPLLILLIFGSACTVSDTAAPKPTPKATAQLKAMLESARHELQRYEEELGQAEREIKASQEDMDHAVSSRLLTRREQLKKKILESKVTVREFEILLNEEQDARN
jgi:hypothetical protein